MPRVLLVDDDIELSTMHKEYLEGEGFTVQLAFDGEAGLALALHGGCDIVVLDVMMPKLSGIETLRRLRRESTIPVLMLTARGDDVDRVVGLELEADDYVAKPCTPRELVARLRAILRRARPAGPAEAAAAKAEILEVGRLRLEPSQRRAELAGRTLDLTSTELNLLEALARSAGSVVSKEELCEKALGRQLTRYDRSIDVHLSHLRAKLGDLPDGRSPIQTVRGFGYQLLSEL